MDYLQARARAQEAEGHEPVPAAFRRSFIRGRGGSRMPIAFEPTSTTTTWRSQQSITPPRRPSTSASTDEAIKSAARKGLELSAYGTAVRSAWPAPIYAIPAHTAEAVQELELRCAPRPARRRGRPGADRVYAGRSGRGGAAVAPSRPSPGQPGRRTRSPNWRRPRRPREERASAGADLRPSVRLGDQTRSDSRSKSALDARRPLLRRWPSFDRMIIGMSSTRTVAVPGSRRR